jgi:hypothetical protein
MGPDIKKKEGLPWLENLPFESHIGTFKKPDVISSSWRLSFSLLS